MLLFTSYFHGLHLCHQKMTYLLVLEVKNTGKSCDWLVWLLFVLYDSCLSALNIYPYLIVVMLDELFYSKIVSCQIF